MPTPGWRIEKSGNVLKRLCSILKNCEEIRMAHGGTDLKEEFSPVLWDASKLYCDAVKEYYLSQEGITEAVYGIDRWSPDLPKYLADRPEKCEETLEIIFSKEYRDNYYDD